MLFTWSLLSEGPLESGLQDLLLFQLIVEVQSVSSLLLRPDKEYSAEDEVKRGRCAPAVHSSTFGCKLSHWVAGVLKP